MFKINLPKDVEFILDRLEKNNYEAYIVGGCVRDSLMGLTPKDWDITTSCPPDTIAEIFNDFTVLEIGKSFGTMNVIINKEQYEITTFRTERGYSDNRHPDKVVFVTDLKEDLTRRDFTINAIAYSHKKGLIDMFDGNLHIKEKKIKCVGSTSRRFDEDPLRMLRAIRFAVKYNFDLDQEIIDFIRENISLIDLLSKERIFKEVCQIVLHYDDSPHFDLLFDVLKHMFPFFKDVCELKQNHPHHIYDLKEHTKKSISVAKKDLVIRFAMLLHDIGKPSVCTIDKEGITRFRGHNEVSKELGRFILNSLKSSNQFKNDVLWLVYNHDTMLNPTPKSVRKQLSKHGQENLERLFEVKMADSLAQSPTYLDQKIETINNFKIIFEEIIAKNECFAIKDLKVNGKDLIELGFVGQEIKIGLEYLLEKIIEEPKLNDKASLIKIAQAKFIDIHEPKN